MRTRRSQSSSDPVSAHSHKSEGHRSVLLQEAIQALEIKPDDIVVDATLGGAGHARYLADMLDREGVFIGFDLDQAAITRAEEALKSIPATKYFIKANFRHMAEKLREKGIERATKILFDLGWSSHQLDSGRGFSFMRDEPLLMTYDDSPSVDALTAEKIVNTWEERSIADVLWGWGGERYSRRIAKAICEARMHMPIQTTRQLAEVVSRAVPSVYRYGKIHPATRTFQALRIAVNDELGALQEGLRSAWQILGHGGILAVITFHSAEDRIVKHMFATWEKAGEGIRTPKKHIAPSEEEIKSNPRARSAKVRIIQKQ